MGNPYTYVTTQEFMKYFGINRIPEDLPRLREFSELLEVGVLACLAPFPASSIL